MAEVYCVTSRAGRKGPCPWDLVCVRCLLVKHRHHVVRKPRPQRGACTERSPGLPAFNLGQAPRTQPLLIAKLLKEGNFEMTLAPATL